MKRIKKIFKSEIDRILHDYDILLIVLAAPLFYALFYGSVYMNKIETNIKVAVVDADKSELSQKIIDDIQAHPTIKIASLPANIEEAKTELLKGDVQSIIEMNYGLSKNIKSRKNGYISLYLNTNRFLVSNDINKAVNQIVARYNYGVRLKYFESKGTNTSIAFQNIMPVRYDIRPVFNISESYGDFLIPGVLILILQQTLLIGLGVSSVKYGLHKGEGIKGIFGKSLPYLIIYSIYALVFYGFLLSFFGIEFSGSIFAAILQTIIFLLNVSLLAEIIGLTIRNKFFVLALITFSSYPIFLLSGYSWEMSWMPGILTPVAYLFPSTPYLNGMIKTISKGAGVAHIANNLLALSIQTIIFLIVIQLTNHKQNIEV